MNILHSIRRHLASRNLQTEFQRVQRERKSVNLDSAHYIALLYHLPDEDTYKKVEVFINQLIEKRNKVRVVAYTPLKYVPHYFMPKLQQDIITVKDLTWTYKPQKPFISDFLAEPFDILIDLCLEDHYPLLYLTAMSHAGMKIGRHIEEHEKYYDLMVSLPPDSTLEDFFSHVTHYLTKIN